MEPAKFAAILPILIGGLVNRIITETDMPEDQAIHALYCTQLYTQLENEATKVWTYSVPMLFDLYQEEIATGELNLPDY